MKDQFLLLSMKIDDEKVHAILEMAFSDVLEGAISKHFSRGATPKTPFFAIIARERLCSHMRFNQSARMRHMQDVPTLNWTFQWPAFAKQPGKVEGIS